jgi:hypothetical protein
MKAAMRRLRMLYLGFWDRLPWIVLIGIGFGVMCALLLDYDHKLEWLGLCAEALVALAIFWELEQNRATEFIAQATASVERGDIYDAFAGFDGDYKQRADAFYKKMKSCRDLRHKCDHQLAVFAGQNHLLKKSLFHRHLMMRWYPHVIVRLWVILHPYLRDRMETMCLDWDRGFVKIAFKSLQRLEDQATEVTIEKSDGTGKLIVRSAELHELKREFKQLIARHKSRQTAGADANSPGKNL